MHTNDAYHPLTDKQIELLKARGCTAEDWSNVLATIDFTTEHVQDVHFAGTVKLGRLAGRMTDESGVSKSAGIFHAFLANCTVGDNVRIANVRGHISGYDIEDDAWIEDVGVLETGAQATFGNGVKVDVLNEAGGRQTVIFNALSSQFAYLHVVVRAHPRATERLGELAAAEVRRAASERGVVGRGTVVHSVERMVDVSVGPFAVIRGAGLLENGTVLSEAAAPTTIGAGVVAKNFIVAEGSVVDDGAMLNSSYVGQGCRVGKQFSAENSLFFANCEAFHGEACSAFAGPFTVTHHKSTLLIAGLFSFYNAGSGTNQSNHRYKLGPVHEGKLERGCKTGSFSYMMWPCRVGPFSVVLGKHGGVFDLGDFPFSHVEAKPDGRTEMIPGFYLTAVGPLRDGAKWPGRDRRRGSVRRDLIHYSVLNPLVAGRMLRGSAKLERLEASTPRTVKTVMVGGAEVRRLLLRKGIGFYRLGLESYLLGCLATRLEAARAQAPQDKSIRQPVAADATFSEDWVDVGGQLMPQTRLQRLVELIEAGEIASVERIDQVLREWHAAYEQDEWAWVCWAAKQTLGLSLDHLGREELASALQRWKAARTKFLSLVLNDAEKEFDKSSQTGFGISGDEDEAQSDFAAVRGTFDDNPFVRQLRTEIAETARRADALIEFLA